MAVLILRSRIPMYGCRRQHNTNCVLPPKALCVTRPYIHSVLESPHAWRQETGEHQVDPYAVTVSRRQEGNPVLKHIRNVRWRYGDIVPDYQMGLNACALFLSLRSAPDLPCCVQ